MPRKRSTGTAVVPNRSVEPIVVPAIRMEQKGLTGESATMYVTTLTLDELLSCTKVDAFGVDNPEGYQRPAEFPRIRDVGRYVMNEQGLLPTNLLLAARPRSGIRYHSLNGSGTLEIPPRTTLWVVDGQHRLQGVRFADAASGKQDEHPLHEYRFPVTVMENVARYDEMVQFSIINSRAKKMSTDIADQHLLARYEREGTAMIAASSRGQREYDQAIAVKATHALNKLEGNPWHGEVRIPGVMGLDKGSIRMHAFVSSLIQGGVFKDSFIRSLEPLPEQLPLLLSAYWNGAREAWFEAFDKPTNYKLVAPLGVYVLHMVMPIAVQKLGSKDLTKDNFRDLFLSTGITAEWWHVEKGHALMKGANMSVFRALAQEIVSSFPSTEGLLEEPATA